MGELNGGSQAARECNAGKRRVRTLTPMRRHMKHWYWLLSITAVLAFGGCTSLSLQGEGVRMTKHESDVADCKALGEVTATPPFIGPNDAKNTLRNKAGDLGGDVLLVTSMSVGTAKGQAYNCGGKYRDR
jgi:hypothetical protein